MKGACANQNLHNSEADWVGIETLMNKRKPFLSSEILTQDGWGHPEVTVPVSYRDMRNVCLAISLFIQCFSEFANYM